MPHAPTLAEDDRGVDEREVAEVRCWLAEERIAQTIVWIGEQPLAVSAYAAAAAHGPGAQPSTCRV